MRTTSIPSSHGTFTNDLHINAYSAHAGVMAAFTRETVMSREGA
jgi:hypothetical protein